MPDASGSHNVTSATDKKVHVCPPSDATHPRDRWETVFVYAFICKFTDLRNKIDGFHSAIDLEEALLAGAPHPILVAILAGFVLNLRPNARNIGADSIAGAVANVFAEHFKTERTVFWDEAHGVNVDPFPSMEEGFFASHWDMKLKVLRTLVEFQLCHSATIKTRIDAAWGVVHNKHKKKDPDPPIDPSSPFSMQSLSFTPLGQDKDRKRYWVVDDSPRVYVSTNPWKITSTFQAVSSTRLEYTALIDELKANVPQKASKSPSKRRTETAHTALITAFEGRLEAIDKEAARLEKARKKAEQRAILMAQAELRSTRTRRQVKRPDYVYNDDIESDDGQDDFVPENEPYEHHDEGFGSDTASSSRHAPSAGRRRSARTAVTNGHKASEPEWRGERRSRRLGGTQQAVDEPPPKRARTVDTAGSSEVERMVEKMEVESVPDTMGTVEGMRVKTAGAAAVKPTEKAVEQLAGRKKSKFWYYAVEPATPSGAQTPSSTGVAEQAKGAANGRDPSEPELDPEPMEVDSSALPAVESLTVNGTHAAPSEE